MIITIEGNGKMKKTIHLNKQKILLDCVISKVFAHQSGRHVKRADIRPEKKE